MSDRLHLIKLAVDIPGPMAMNEPLSSVEKVFLTKLFGSHIVQQIEQGCLWQGS